MYIHKCRKLRIHIHMQSVHTYSNTYTSDSSHLQMYWHIHTMVHTYIYRLIKKIHVSTHTFNPLSTYACKQYTCKHIYTHIYKSISWQKHILFMLLCHTQSVFVTTYRHANMHTYQHNYTPQTYTFTIRPYTQYQTFRWITIRILCLPIVTFCISHTCLEVMRPRPLQSFSWAISRFMYLYCHTYIQICVINMYIY